MNRLLILIVLYIEVFSLRLFQTGSQLDHAQPLIEYECSELAVACASSAYTDPA